MNKMLVYDVESKNRLLTLAPHQSDNIYIDTAVK